MSKSSNRKVLENLYLPSRFLDKLIKDLDYILKININTLELIVLFGSCSNGRLKVTSDIDLLLVTSEKPNQTLRGEIAAELAEPINGVASDVVFYTINEIKSGTSLFLKQFMEEGIVIWKKD